MSRPYTEPKLTSIPETPAAFGDDGGHFYRYYDALADELDEDMVRSLKAQLDGILIFAGLFAGVNTAFLALTLPALSPDPSDDTNALLLQLVLGRNGTIQSAQDLPSSSFSPTPSILPANILLAISLVFALITAFLAVLGQQWLVYYRKRSGGGAERQRWEQLRRYLGAKRWRLELVLDDILPGLLQAALIVFCVALVIYLKSLSTLLYYSVLVPMAVALGGLVLMAVAVGFDKWCPFKSPLSQLLHVISAPARWLGLTEWCWYIEIVPYIFVVIYTIVAITICNTYRFITHLWRGHIPHYDSYSDILEDATSVVAFHSREESPERIEELQMIAAKRVLSTSEDHNATIYTCVNLQAVTSAYQARLFLKDDFMYQRLTSEWIYSSSYTNLLDPELVRTCCHLLLMAELPGESLKAFSYGAYPGWNSDGSELLQRVRHICALTRPGRPGTSAAENTHKTEIFLVFYLLESLLRKESTPTLLRLSHWFSDFINHYPSPQNCPLTATSLIPACILMSQKYYSISDTSNQLSGLRSNRWLEERNEMFDTFLSYLNLRKDRSGFQDYRILQAVDASLSDDRISNEIPPKIALWLLQKAFYVAESKGNTRECEDIAGYAARMLGNFARGSDTVTPKDGSPGGLSDHVICLQVLCQTLSVLKGRSLDVRLYQRPLAASLFEDLSLAMSHSSSLIREVNDDTSAMVALWPEIMETLGEPRQHGEVGYDNSWTREYESVYPEIKAAFERMKTIAINLGINPNRMKDGPPSDPPIAPNPLSNAGGTIVEVVGPTSE